MNTNAHSKKEDGSRLRPVWVFLLETLTNLAVFGVLALSAIGFDWVISRMHDVDLPSILSVTFKWMEYALFTLNIAFFLVAQTTALVRFVRLVFQHNLADSEHSNDR